MINQSLIVEETTEFVREKLSGETTGHDWFHTERVFRLANYIAEKEGADIFIVQLASLLHDIADWKFHDGNEEKGPEIAATWLNNSGLDKSRINLIRDIIREVTFKGNKVENKISTIEGKVVQDADRLDAIGAIGIARAFAYGGYRGNEIYNPALKPKNHNSFEEYKKNKGTTINHFYEKLLLLKDMMNTQTGREIAEKRHKFMEIFLENFYKEWNLDL